MSHRHRGARALLAALLGAASLPPAADAHPGPAEPPAFGVGPCIVTVDRQEETSWHMTYGVPVEDTAPDPDLVALPDTKTHEFFAVAGHVFERAMGYAVVPFGDTGGTARELPTWLGQDDVTRVREAGADHPTALADLPQDVATLEQDPELAALVQPFGNQPARVPITLVQAVRGVTWDLGAAPAGVYQIAAYVFSPPYNAWAPRPGLVKVVDGPDASPVLWLDSVGARLFQGQGRRVTGCVDAPEGSTLVIRARPAAEPDMDYEVWLDDVPVDAGRFEACLLNRGRDASLALEVTVTTPNGEHATAYSVETIDTFSTPAACHPSDTLCCDPAADAGTAGSATEDDAGAGPVGAGADTPGKPDAARPGDDTDALADAATRSDATDASSGGPRGENHEVSTAGCGCRLDAGGSLARGKISLLFSLLALALVGLRRRAHRRPALLRR